MVVSTVRDLRRFIDEAVARHVVTGKRCSCGWEPDVGIGPNPNEHADIAVLDEVYGVVPSDTFDGGLHRTMSGREVERWLQLCIDRRGDEWEPDPENDDGPSVVAEA